MTDKPCKFYISGKKCKFGKHCKFLHPEANISNLHLDNQSDNNGILNNNSHSSDFVPSLENTLSSYQQDHSHGELSERYLKSAQKPVCHFYVRNGFCDYGRNCRFSHPQIQDRLKSYQHQEDVPTNAGSDFGNAGHTKDQASAQSRVATRQEDASTGSGRENSEPKSSEEKRRLCQFFSEHGYCKFGRSCRFLHFYSKKKATTESSNSINPEDALAEKERNVEQPGSNDSLIEEKSNNKKLCSYFKNGKCKWGDSCRFVHAKNEMKDDAVKDCDTDTPKILNVKPQPVLRAVRQPFIPVKKIQKRSEATEEEIAILRKTELEQFIKRFPSDKLSVVTDNEDHFIGRFSFTPSDPDWPFDLRNFLIEVEFPARYPMEMLQLKLPEDQDMPDIVRKYVEEGINEWIEEKRDTLEKSDQLELIFRPLLRWMEKNLESVVTNALRQFKKELVAKAAGFEFIPASQLQANVKQDEASAEMSDEEQETNSSDGTDEETGSSTSDSGQDEEQFVEADVDKKGTEISLKNLQLKGQTGTLSIKKIYITIQCGRCKNKTDFSTPGNRLNSIDCTKCHETQLLRYRPTISHQYSSVIGYLDLNNCIPFDLVLQECHPIVSCMKCNRSSSITGFCRGQPNDINCRSCHERLRVAFETVKFFELQQQVQSLDVKQVHKIGVKKQTRVSKDPAIQEGKPLPNNGACKHYKKSFRWLRFPCCGKTYPCDVCHEEKESDHEMKYANRMICGFCCREQVFSVEKPCKGCDSLMTKSSGRHWEGGQGCRDKIRMSRGDSQKFSNMNKTISKHSQKVKDMNSKKKTKLRHA